MLAIQVLRLDFESLSLETSEGTSRGLEGPQRLLLDWENSEPFIVFEVIEDVLSTLIAHQSPADLPRT